MILMECMGIMVPLALVMSSLRPWLGKETRGSTSTQSGEGFALNRPDQWRVEMENPVHYQNQKKEHKFVIHTKNYMYYWLNRPSIYPPKNIVSFHLR